MKNLTSDIRLIFGVLLAHSLMYFAFQEKAVFWYIFPASLLILISYSILNEEAEDKISFLYSITVGAITGLAIYAIFWAGFSLIDFFDLSLKNQVSKLYRRYSPSLLWHYIVLLLIIIPGEEIFWRGFVQRKVLKYTNIPAAIIISSILYASVHLYSGYWILAFAAFCAGLFWGWLYAWKRSIPLVIASHLTFDLLLFVFVPFY